MRPCGGSRQVQAMRTAAIGDASAGGRCSARLVRDVVVRPAPAGDPGGGGAVAGSFVAAAPGGGGGRAGGGAGVRGVWLRLVGGVFFFKQKTAYEIST